MFFLRPPSALWTLYLLALFLRLILLCDIWHNCMLLYALVDIFLSTVLLLSLLSYSLSLIYRPLFLCGRELWIAQLMRVTSICCTCCNLWHCPLTVLNEAIIVEL